jgi:hypothetical protein
MMKRVVVVVVEGFVELRRWEGERGRRDIGTW